MVKERRVQAENLGWARAWPLTQRFLWSPEKISVQAKLLMMNRHCMWALLCPDSELPTPKRLHNSVVQSISVGPETDQSDYTVLKNILKKKWKLL